MSVVMKVSYEEPQELEAIRERLADLGMDCDIVGRVTGKYRRAYIKSKGYQYHTRSERRKIRNTLSDTAVQTSET